MTDSEKVINGVEHCFHGQECCGDIECPYYIEHLSDSCCLEECQENLKADIIALLKEQEKLINVDNLREKLGFSDNCENCKQNARYCQYDSHFALMDFCERLDMAIEELMQEGR